jgi:hypothetical protein
VRLADDLYFIAHDDHTGRPHLYPRAIQLGLAAALLGELMLADRLTVQSGRIYLRSQQPPPDALAHAVLDRLAGQPHRELRTELAVIAGNAEQAVAHRLEGTGLVRYVQTRRLTRSTGHWAPTDPAQAAWRTIRLRQLLSDGDELSWYDVMLAALLSAVGATARVLRDAEPQARTRLTAIMARLPGSVAELVAHAEAAVGNAVLAQRR